MRRVIIESPFAANETASEAEHKAYLQRCILDCFNQGEAPFASHQMYTEALRDSNEVERRLGIEAGFGWRPQADATVVYTDYGISRGMALGVAHAQGLAAGRSHSIEYRNIGRNP